MPNQNVLITGANRGVGLEFVRQLLGRGYRVVATCRHPGKASELIGLVGEYPGRLHVLPLDVADSKSQAELVRELPLVLGQHARIELLINNAGVLHSGERFGNLTLDRLQDSFLINCAGPLMLTQTLAGSLQDDARVVNLSSQLGSIANTTRFGTPTYGISKAAQNMATVQLAHALRDRGIVVIAVHPGWVQTDMGGKEATLAPSESVSGLLQVIEKLRLEDSGRFLDWQGQPLPW